MKLPYAWAVLALSLLSGSGWLLVQAYPSGLAPAAAGCIHFAVIGCIGLGVCVVSRSAFRRQNKTRHSVSRHTVALVGLAGACIFALPTIVLDIVSTSISPSTSLVIFCAIPIFTILAQPSLESRGAVSGNPQHLLIPSLIGLSGALILLPLGLPHSLHAAFFFAVVTGSCVALAFATVWMHHLLRGIQVAHAVAAVALPSALLLGLYAAAEAGWQGTMFNLIAAEALRSLVIDLPVVWLTVWLAREVQPARLASRFPLALLVTLVEGFVSERVPLSPRTIAGLALLAGGGLLLLFKDEPGELPGLSLR